MSDETKIETKIGNSLDTMRQISAELPSALGGEIFSTGDPVVEIVDGAISLATQPITIGRKLNVRFRVDDDGITAISDDETAESIRELIDA